MFARSGSAGTTATTAPNARPVAGVGVRRASTQSISIPNNSFEDGTLPLNIGPGPYSNILAGSKFPIGGELASWQAGGTTTNACAGAYSSTTMAHWWQGNAFGYVYLFGPGTAWLSQAASATLQNDTTYTLSAVIAAVPGFPHLSYSLQLWAGASMVASTGAFQVRSISFPARTR